jgi:protein TonB
LSFISFTISAQEEKVELIAELDTPPIISGCNSKVDKEDILICLQDRFPKLLTKNLKISVFQKQNLPRGKYQINTSFKISKKAKIIDIKVAYDNDEIVHEITRALKKIKIKNPGIIDGKPVGVKYTLPIYFTLE